MVKSEICTTLRPSTPFAKHIHILFLFYWPVQRNCQSICVTKFHLFNHFQSQTFIVSFMLCLLSLIVASPAIKNCTCSLGRFKIWLFCQINLLSWIGVPFGSYGLCVFYETWFILLLVWALEIWRLRVANHFDLESCIIPQMKGFVILNNVCHKCKLLNKYLTQHSPNKVSEFDPCFMPIPGTSKFILV